LLLALLLRLPLAWVPLDKALEKFISDDAFYYFLIARHLAQGKGASINGLNPTNGFHPLWALLLAILHIPCPQSPLPVHLGLTLAALLDCATVLALYITVSVLGDKGPAALWASLFYALNPLVILEAMGGLETALGLFLLALTCLCYAQIWTKERPSTADYALLGAAGGLMMLARTDYVFFLIAILALEARRRRGLMPVAVVGLLAGGMLLPWLIWSWRVVGTPVQTSGVAVPFVVSEHLFSDRGWLRFIGPPLYLSSMLAGYLVRYAFAELAVIAGLCLVWGLRRRRLSLSLPSPMWATIAGAGALLLFHAFVRWFLRGWYFVPMVYALAPLAGHFLAQAEAESRLPRRITAGVILLGLFLVLALQGGREWKRGLYPWQAQMKEAALRVARELPTEVRIGSFNAGIPAYFSDRVVINLDGVVNGEALKALRERRLLAYAREAGIGYILDWKRTVEEIYAPFLTPQRQGQLEVVWEMPYGTDAVRLYRLGP